MSLLLYASTAVILLLFAHRFVARISPVAAIILLLAPLGFTGRALLTGGVYGPLDHAYRSEPLSALKAEYGIGEPHNPAVTDIYSQMFPWRRAVQESIARGEWPLWNPYILCGHLLAGASQPAIYSPFTLIALLLPAAQSFAYTAAIAFFLAALGTYLFARELGCSEAASLVAAIAWMSCTPFVLYVLWPLGFTWAYFPSVLLATRRVVHSPAIASGSLLVITLSLSLVAGHPETVAHVVLLGCVYAAFEMIRGRVHPLRPIVVALASGIVTACLCAIFLLPVREAVWQSGEYQYKSAVWAHEDRGAPPAKVLASLSADAFPWLHLRPGFKGESSAVGSIVIALGLYALWRRRSRETWFFAALAVTCIALEVEWGPVANALRHMPLLDITHNERLGFAAAFFLSILAAFGLDEILRRRNAEAAIVAGSVLTLLVIGTLVLWKPQEWRPYTLWAELVGLTALVVLLALGRRQVAWLVLVLLFAQRVPSESSLHRTFPGEAAYPHLSLFEGLDRIREPYRIVGLQYALIPGTSTFYGLEDARGYEAVTFAPIGKTFPLWSQYQIVWFNRVDDLTRPFLSFLNVRFAIAAERANVPPGWRRIASDRGSMLLENERVIDRLFVPNRVRIGLTADQALEEMLGESDFRARAWIDAPDPAPERINGPGRVTLRHRRKGGEYLADVEMQNDGWVVVSDTAWKGWRAYIDGRRVETTRANIAFLSVFVPKGKHTIRLAYWPESFVVGRAISAATVLALIAFALISVRWARNA